MSSFTALFSVGGGATTGADKSAGVVVVKVTRGDEQAEVLLEGTEASGGSVVVITLQKDHFREKLYQHI